MLKQNPHSGDGDDYELGGKGYRGDSLSFNLFI